MTNECQQDDRPHKWVVDEFRKRIPKEEHQRMTAIVLFIFRVLLVDATSAEESKEPFFVRFLRKEANFINFVDRKRSIGAPLYKGLKSVYQPT